MESGKLDTHMPKDETRPLALTLHTNQLQTEKKLAEEKGWSVLKGVSGTLNDKVVCPALTNETS